MKDVACAKCGKMFIPAIEHAYKDSRGVYCTWHCFNHRNDGKKDSQEKPVIQYSKSGEFIKEYKNPAEAARSVGCDVYLLTRCCRRETKSTGGYMWRYKADVLS